MMTEFRLDGYNRTIDPRDNSNLFTLCSSQSFGAEVILLTSLMMARLMFEDGLYYRIVQVSGDVWKSRGTELQGDGWRYRLVELRSMEDGSMWRVAEHGLGPGVDVIGLMLSHPESWYRVEVA